MKRFIFCGGRTYDQRVVVRNALIAMVARYGRFIVIHGGAPGADHLSAAEARKLDLPTLCVPARWDSGKGAGPERNQEMLSIIGRPQGLIVFPGGRGTADMVKRAQRAGVPVWFRFGQPPSIDPHG